METMAGLPWEPVPGRQGIEIKSDVRMQLESGEFMKDPDTIPTRAYQRRSVKIMREDVQKYGLTPG